LEEIRKNGDLLSSEMSDRTVLKLDKIEMRTYLDTCVWCRPFDAMTSDRILQEAESVNKLTRKVDNNEIEIVGSSVLLFEVSMISDNLKRISVEKLIARVATEISPVTASTKGLAGQIMNSCGVGAMDAMHLAIAVECGAQVFLTTDDAILSSADRISAYSITVKNPTEMV
jgi:predicted nucleic acid-binding protein